MKAKQTMCLLVFGFFAAGLLTGQQQTKDAQFIRDLTALASSINDYRDEYGVMVFNLTEQNVSRALDLIIKYMNREFFEEEVTNAFYFTGIAGMYGSECNVTICYDTKKSGKDNRGIELFSPARKKVYFTDEDYIKKRKLPGEK
jgi:hypothetical protein